MKLSLLSVALLLLLASCQQRMYFPDRANVLGFKEKGEAKLTASFKPQGDDASNNAPAQISPAVDAAYAISDCIAIFGSYRSTINRNISEYQALSYGGLFNGRRYEGGVGYFHGFDNRAVMEILAGYGNGNLKRRGKLLPGYDFDTRYHRWFVQGAGGYSDNIISIIGGARIALQRYYDFVSAKPGLEYSIAARNYYRYGQLPRSVMDQYFTFIEPFFNVEIGYKYIKLNGQFGTAIQVTGGRVAGNTPIFGSVGIVLHYAPRFFKKNAMNDNGTNFK